MADALARSELADHSKTSCAASAQNCQCAGSSQDSDSTAASESSPKSTMNTGIVGLGAVVNPKVSSACDTDAREAARRFFRSRFDEARRRGKSPNSAAVEVLRLCDRRERTTKTAVDIKPAEARPAETSASSRVCAPSNNRETQATPNPSWVLRPSASSRGAANERRPANKEVSPVASSTVTSTSSAASPASASHQETSPESVTTQKRVRAWKQGKNLRVLLSTLHEVAPVGAWEAVVLDELKQQSVVKTTFRKAVQALRPAQQEDDLLRDLLTQALRAEWDTYCLSGFRKLC
uniref:Uncharacterized protein n=1 Tax=Noctiluca scintillans TaxID=2966 RepID=A0A7S1B1M4_NOCSC|mmetsp:Transcript_8656/g.24132  ORF Transcript_8656/g.24132 Transcript_8656/m.24132 type:complete len:293 (+) Transcript_8656:73-951(+)|eukprot:CAMPEP_0194511888 /NCGR_PEP_ID=MMETSP0253-20130528/43695_1 /TAXON_ID=2966 /ORGANISM="Noctiluca scintillans" /LENGTH=292 /DNA_ID=CAMNT_0039355267 /DNA_START=68 /DNA_END=946 /DNA_ORIENTATION=+